VTRERSVYYFGDKKLEKDAVGSRQSKRGRRGISADQTDQKEYDLLMSEVCIME
jgi:hypothetical protein